MMNYELTERQKNLKREFKKFCGEFIVPSAGAFDDETRENAGSKMRANLKKLAEAEYYGLALEGDFITSTVVGEELARACPSTFLSALASVTSFGLPVKKFGTAAQKERYLSGLVNGTITGCLGYSEIQAGSDLSGLAMTADKKGDAWVLNGKKDLVTNAPFADAFLVLAWTERAGGLDKGLTFFIVDKETAGLTVGKPAETMGLRGALTSAVEFADCIVGDNAVLGGAVGSGYQELMAALEYINVGVSTLALGIGAACMEASTILGKSRKAFGKPIGLFEGVGAKLAVMFTNNDLMRLIMIKAAWAIETGQTDRKIVASCAKLFSSEAVIQIADMAMQVHGGHGYVKGAMVERLYRDARFAALAYGTSEIQRAVIARDSLDRYRAG